jgi:hypothetical protein
MDFLGVMQAGALASAALLWMAFRTQRTCTDRRRWATVSLSLSVLLPSLLVSLLFVSLRTAAILTLALLGAAILEALMIGDRGSKLPPRVRAYWIALISAVGGFAVIDSLYGALPEWPAVLLLVAFCLAAYIRVDRASLEAAITPVWEVFSAFMLVSLPFSLLSTDGWIQGNANSVETTGDDSYRNSLWALLGVDERWSGIFSHPNTLGAFSAIGIAISLAGERVRARLLVLSFPLLAASSSRTAAAAALATACVFLLQKGAWRWKWPVAGVVVLASLAVLRTALLDGSYATGTGRYDVWGGVIAEVSGSWLLGLGPEGARDLIAVGVLPGWAVSPHSIWLKALLTAGVVGVLLTLLVFVAGFRLRAGRPLLAALVVLSAFDNTADLRGWSVGSLALIALAASATPAIASERPSPSGRARIRGMVAPAHTSRAG